MLCSEIGLSAATQKASIWRCEAGVRRNCELRGPSRRATYLLDNIELFPDFVATSDCFLMLVQAPNRGEICAIKKYINKSWQLIHVRREMCPTQKTDIFITQFKRFTSDTKTFYKKCWIVDGYKFALLLYGETGTSRRRNDDRSSQCTWW